MTIETAAIASTLTPGAFKGRMAWVADLTREALRERRNDGLILHLTYAPEAAGRVRDLISRESECCAFLGFDLREDGGAVHLTVTAPAEAQGVADLLFAQFLPQDAGASAAWTRPDPTADRCSCRTAGGPR